MINGSVTNMVANVVNNASAATSTTGAAADQSGAASADGFLQALMGLFGTVAPAPAAPAAVPSVAADAAGTDEDSTANADGSLSIDPSLLMSLPGWTPGMQAVPTAPAAPVQTGDAAIGAAKVASQAGVSIDVLPSLPASAEQAEAQILPPSVDTATAVPPNVVTAPPQKASSNSSKAERQSLSNLFNMNLRAGDTDAARNAKAEAAPMAIPPELESEIAANAGENALFAEKFGEARDDSRRQNSVIDPAKLEMEFGLNLFEPVVAAGDQAPPDATAPSDIAAMSLSSARAAAHAETQPTTETATATLHNRVGTHAWREELGTQLNWMVDNGKHTASLKLSPEHLGPVEVRIDLNKDQVSVWFTAANGETRSAIEQALPKLREMMESQGMSLTDAGVFREPPRERTREQPAVTAAITAESHEETVQASAKAARLGLLDTYA